MQLVVSTPPTGEVISMDIVNAHLRADPGDEQDLIAYYLAAAVAHVENVCEHALGAQSWTAYLERWELPIELRGGNVRGVTSVSYRDSTGARVTMATDAYQTRLGRFACVRPLYGQAWPRTAPGEAGIEIVYDVGYAEADIPKTLISAVLLLVGDMYEVRTPVIAGTQFENKTVDRLLWPYKRIAP